MDKCRRATSGDKGDEVGDEEDDDDETDGVMIEGRREEKERDNEVQALANRLHTKGEESEIEGGRVVAAVRESKGRPA